MLYEVITSAFQNFLIMPLTMLSGVFYSIRITSYNVCYTKLLRAWTRCSVRIAGSYFEDAPLDQTADDVLVELRDVRFAYGEREILRGVDLRIHRGQLVAIMGGSGCGKTTLLRLIGRQLRPASGTIHVDGVDIAGLT